MKNVLYFFVFAFVYYIPYISYANDRYLETKTISYIYQNNEWVISYQSGINSYKFDSLGRLVESYNILNDTILCKSISEYDSENNLVKVNYFSLKNNSNELYLQTKYLYSYKNGLQTYSEQQTFDTVNQLISDNKKISIYENNKLKSVGNWIWQNGIWVNSSDIEYSIVDSVNRIEQALGYGYTSGMKFLSGKMTYQYNALHLPEQITTETNVNSKDSIPKWVLLAQESYTYNTKGQAVILEEKMYDIFSNKIDEYNRYSYKYNDSDKITELLGQQWDNSAQGFANNFKVEHFYADFPTDVHDAQNFAGNIASISPNPVSDILNIQLPSGSFGSAQVKIYSQNGEEVLSRNVEIESGSTSFRLDKLCSLSSGIYLVSVNINGTFYHQKFLKM